MAYQLPQELDPECSFNILPPRRNCVFPPSHLSKRAASLDDRYMTPEEQRAYRTFQCPENLYRRLCGIALPYEGPFEPPWKPISATKPNEASYTMLNSQYNTFSKFADLSVNLRNKIWTIAIADDARVFEMRHPDLLVARDYSGTCEINRQHLIKPRALQFACVESRLLFAEVDFGNKCYFLINFDVDTIYFGPESYWYDERLWRAYPQNDEELAAWESDEGWSWKQTWNHWRDGDSNIEKGEETLRDRPYDRPYENPSSGNCYHPLLSDTLYDIERSQIKNVAFDLEFWEETARRRSGGQEALVSQFPSAKRIVLAAGDVGESSDVIRIDDQDGMKVMYTSRVDRLTRVTSQPAVRYTGQLEFHAAVNQERLSTDVGEQLKSGFVGMAGGVDFTLEVMCVTRGGRYKGHPCRIIRKDLRARCKRINLNKNGHQYCDSRRGDGSVFSPGRSESRDWDLESSQEYIPDPQDEEDDLSIDMREERAIGRRFPCKKEVEDLLDPNRNQAELEDLPELIKALSHHKFKGERVKHFHENADRFGHVPADHDVSEDESESHNVEKGNAEVEEEAGYEEGPGEEAEGTIVPNPPSAERSKSATPEEQPKLIAKKRKPVAQNQQAQSSNDKCTEVKNGTGKKRKLNPPKNPALPGQRVGAIHDSAVKFQILCYRVTWEWVDDQGNGTPDDRAPLDWLRHTEPYFEGDHVERLVREFHKEHPNAPDLETARNTTRQKWGTGSGRLEDSSGAAGPSQPSNASSSPTSSAQKANSALGDDADAEWESEYNEAESSLSSITTPSLTTPQDEDDDDMEDVIVVDAPSPAPLEQQQQRSHGVMDVQMSQARVHQIRNDDSTAMAVSQSNILHGGPILPPTPPPLAASS